jgi:hypothetical protein
MPRYRSVHEYNGPGGNIEFTAADDAAAIAQAENMARIYGEVRSLSEILSYNPPLHRAVSTGNTREEPRP